MRTGRPRAKLPPLTDAQRDLAAANVGLAYTFAGRFAGTGGPLDADELLSACFEGLIYAARKFDAGRGARFSSYAWLWMRQSAQNCGRRQHSIPVAKNATTGRSRNEECRRAAVRTMAMRRVGFVSVGVLDTGPDVVDDADRFERVMAELRWLDRDQRHVVEQRLAGRTLVDIGRDLDVCRERVRQIEGEAWERIRAGLGRLA